MSPEYYLKILLYFALIVIIIGAVLSAIVIVLDWINDPTGTAHESTEKYDGP